MFKRGMTILELLLSILLISMIILLLLKVMLSLENINNDKNYASNDELKRTELIKTIESDFIANKLNGLSINKENNKVLINLNYKDQLQKIIVTPESITYDSETYKLKSSNATYDLCIKYDYFDLDNDYYLINITIPVLINGQNTTTNDDIKLTYVGLNNITTNYPLSYSC